MGVELTRLGVNEFALVGQMPQLHLLFILCETSPFRLCLHFTEIYFIIFIANALLVLSVLTHRGQIVR